jgi:hypothetical protein
VKEGIRRPAHVLAGLLALFLVVLRQTDYPGWTPQNAPLMLAIVAASYLLVWSVVRGVTAVVLWVIAGFRHPKGSHNTHHQDGFS